MANRQHELAFTYESRLAGCFQEPVCPRAPGRYRYRPYRSIGHLALCQAIRAGKRPHCAMVANPALTFVVVAHPEYGVVELADIAFGNAS